jgi:hypothetical protein
MGFNLAFKGLILIGHIHKIFVSESPKLALIQHIPLITKETTLFYSSDILAIITGINMRYTKLYGECLSMSYEQTHIIQRNVYYICRN